MRLEQSAATFLDIQRDLVTVRVKPARRETVMREGWTDRWMVLRPLFWVPGLWFIDL